MDTFEALFESDQRVSSVLKSAAPLFFRDINLILQEHIILQVCRITDPATSQGRENLTVKMLNVLLKSEELLDTEIETQACALHDYRKFIELARNRVISHADKTTILSKTETAPHSREELERFINALHNYVNLVGEAVGVGPLDFTSTNAAGDACDLVSCLERGLQKDGSHAA